MKEFIGAVLAKEKRNEVAAFGWKKSGHFRAMWKFVWILMASFCLWGMGCQNGDGGSGSSPEVSKYQDTQIDSNSETQRLPFRSANADLVVTESVRGRGASIYVAWVDSRDGDRNPYFNAKSDETGLWLHLDDLRLNPGEVGNLASSVKICSSADGRYIHVVWADAQPEYEAIHYTTSSDYGRTFLAAPLCLSPGWPFPWEGSEPVVCCSRNGSKIFVAWRHGNTDIAFRYSTDYGATWSTTDDPGQFFANTDPKGYLFAGGPSIDCSDNGDYCHLGWIDFRNIGTENFYPFHRCFDSVSGSWKTTEDHCLSTNRAYSMVIKCTASGQDVHAAWLFFDKGMIHDSSANYGDTWGADEEVSEFPSPYDYAGAMTCDRSNGNICIVWDRRIDNPNAQWAVMARAKKAGAWGWEVRLSPFSSKSEKSLNLLPSVCSYGSNVYVVWADYRQMPNETIYYHYSIDGGGTWTGYGTQLNSPGGQASFKIDSPVVATNSSGVRYAAWTESRGGEIPVIYGKTPNGASAEDELIPHSREGVAHAWQGQIVANGQNVYGTWLTGRHGNRDVYFNRSSNDGFDWGDASIVNEAQGEYCRYPQISCDGTDHVYVVWEYPDRQSTPGNNVPVETIYFRRYTSSRADKTVRLEFGEKDRHGSPRQERGRKLPPFSPTKEIVHGSKTREPIPQEYNGGKPRIQNDDQGHVYVTYRDSSSYNYNDIYLIPSNDRGSSWEKESRFTDFGGHPCSYDFIREGQYIYTAVAYQSENESFLAFRRNTNYGESASWDAIQWIYSSNPEVSRKPRICASGSNVFLVWQDGTKSRPDVYYSYSVDHGSTWSEPAQFDHDTTNSWISGEIESTTCGDELYVVWTNHDPASRRFSVYFNRLQVQGNLLGIPFRLNDSVAGARNPAIVCDGQRIYVAWQDKKYGAYDILGRTSRDGGATWGGICRWDTNAPGRAHSIKPQLKLSDAWVHCVWTDYRQGMNVFYEQRKR